MMNFIVKDMTCGHCAGTITKAVQAADPQAMVAIDLASHRVQVDSRLDTATVAAAIRQAGYTPEPLAA
jgi:copper chaperone CopZ